MRRYYHIYFFKCLHLWRWLLPFLSSCIYIHCHIINVNLQILLNNFITRHFCMKPVIRWCPITSGRRNIYQQVIYMRVQNKNWNKNDLGIYLICVLPRSLFCVSYVVGNTDMVHFMKWNINLCSCVKTFTQYWRLYYYFCLFHVMSVWTCETVDESISPRVGDTEWVGE